MMIESVWNWLQTNAPWLDTLALFVVCIISYKRKDLIGLVILLDFALVFFAQDWIQSLEFWGSLGLDYQYTLGIKDTLLAATLLFLAASPWLMLAYIIPALTCWIVWASYSLTDYETFLIYYYAWSPVYALAMFIQVYGLTIGDSNAGKRIRAKLVPTHWYRVLQPVNRLVYAHITPDSIKIERT